MWFSSARFLLFPALLSFAALSLGMPIPQQAPSFSVRAASLELEDDPARLRRYQSYGLKQATVERVQPVSNVHPDAAPFMNTPDVRETIANPTGRSSMAGFDSAIQDPQASRASAQIPQAAPLSEVPYSGQREGTSGSALPDNVVSQTMSTQGPSGVRSSVEADVSGPAIPTSDAYLHMSSGVGAYASQGGINMAPRTEQTVPGTASSAMPEGAVGSLEGSPGLASPIQTASQGNANVPEANVGAQTASLVGTSTVRQGIPEQTQESAELLNSYNSGIAETAAAQGGQFNGQEGSHAQYGERVGAGGMQMLSQGLGVPGAIPGNVGHEAYAVRTNSDGPMVGGPIVGGRPMVA